MQWGADRIRVAQKLGCLKSRPLARHRHQKKSAVKNGKKKKPNSDIAIPVLSVSTVVVEKSHYNTIRGK